MSNCTLCRSFGEEHRPDGTGTWDCLCEDVSLEDFGEQLMDDAEPCPHWYPGKGQKVYTLGEGEWEHTCQGMPLLCLLGWSQKAMAWCLWDGIAEEWQILFCPWCGTELLPMPEVAT